MGERIEALMRIVVGIISGIILGVWKGVVQLVSFVHWIFVLVGGERNQALAEFCEIWNTQVYIFLRYMNFVSNERPFPFSRLTKNLSKYKK